jgi:hypothetical protein
MIKGVEITSHEEGTVNQIDLSWLIPENERECRTPNSHLLKPLSIDYTQSLKEIIY